MASTVYLETTIPSYLTAWRSPEVIMAARQEITRDWWENRRTNFDLFVSQLVWDEASAGDADAVARRIAVLKGIPLIEAVAGTEELIDALMRELSLPPRAAADAVHIALSVVNGMDFLLTWNCTHIANAANRPIIEDSLRFTRLRNTDHLYTGRTAIVLIYEARFDPFGNTPHKGILRRAVRRRHSCDAGRSSASAKGKRACGRPPDTEEA